MAVHGRIGNNYIMIDALTATTSVSQTDTRAYFYTEASPVCALCEADSPDIQMSGLFCVTPFRTNGRSRLSARSALQSVSRFEVSTRDLRPHAVLRPPG